MRTSITNGDESLKKIGWKEALEVNTHSKYSNYKVRAGCSEPCPLGFETPGVEMLQSFSIIANYSHVTNFLSFSL